MPEIKQKRGMNRKGSYGSIGTTTTEAILQNLKNHLISKDKGGKKFNSARSIDANAINNACAESPNLEAIEELDSMQ